MTNHFTIDQIRTAHAKVKTGADFPTFIHEISQLGVTNYHSYVADGHVNYHGEGEYTQSAPPKYPVLSISEKTDRDIFTARLKVHQQGGTDYITFCKESAAAGIEKWVVDLVAMTCTYYNKNGEEILVENIPGIA